MYLGIDDPVGSRVEVELLVELVLEYRQHRPHSTSASTPSHRRRVLLPSTPILQQHPIGFEEIRLCRAGSALRTWK